MRKKSLIKRIGKDLDEVINSIADETELSYTDASNILARKYKKRRGVNEIDF